MQAPQPVLLALAALACAALPALAQTPQRPLPPGLEDLPIGLAPWERVPAGPAPGLRTAAPFGPVRAAAEWDESRGVFCLWDNASLMNELRKDNEVYVITQNQAWWTSWLASNAIPTTNFRFLNAPTNTWWVRDYGPWFVWDGAQQFGLVDQTYNRPRPLDNAIPAAIASTYGVAYYGVDLVHTGGNYYTDGYGTGWSTSLVLTENPGKTEAQVRALMEQYLGITRYVTPLIPVDIQHFDTFGKPLAPDVLLWGSFPEHTTAWVYTEAALKQFEELQSPYGWPYEIHRMPLWSQASSWTAYINSLQTNGKLVVASYNTANDAQAQSIYEAAAPGYQVALVSAGGTLWGDSVHCRARNFIRGDGLRIYAYPHWKRSDDQVQGYAVRAEVIPPPGASLVGAPTLYWSLLGGPPWQQTAMAPTGAPFEYAGTIPAAPHGSEVTYFVQALDSAGNLRAAPPVAPAGTFSILVAPDLDPPELEHTPPHVVLPSEWPLEIACKALDATGIPELTLEYRVNNVPRPSVPMVKDPGTFVFRASMAGAANLGDLVSYRILASDQASPPNSSASPQQGWHYARVDDRRSVLVVELDPTPSSGQGWVEWCSDLGFDAKLVAEWPASLSGCDVVIVCLGMSPAHRTLSSAQASALTAFLNAGGAALVEGGNAWSQGSSSIYRPFFGVASASNGANLTVPLTGVAGELTEGMGFAYQGERNASDHLTPASGSQAILRAGANTKAVAYQTSAFRTVAASFQFAGLVDAGAPSRAKYLAGRLLEHLGLDVSLVATPDPADPYRVTFDVWGEPGMNFGVFGSLETGYLNYGLPGILRIHRGTAALLAAGVFAGDGSARVVVDLPPGSYPAGTELFVQAYARNSGPVGFGLTNADRLTIGP